MARADVTERIHASPGRIWRHFAPEQFAGWYGDGWTLLSPTLAVGSQVRVGGREATVVEYAENRKLAWETADGDRVGFTLGPKEGYTVMLLRVEFTPSGLVGRLTEGSRLRRLSVHAQQALGKLKRLAEG